MLSPRSTLWLFLLLISTLAAQAKDPKSWENVRRLAPGQSVEVTIRKSGSIKGAVAGVSEDSITIMEKDQTRVLSRPEVSRVRIRSRRRLMYTLIGTAVGAGAGVALGAAGGESLAQTSGGDFANLKPAITGGCGAVGAVIGAVIGSVAGHRGTTVYRVK